MSPILTPIIMELSTFQLSYNRIGEKVTQKIGCGVEKTENIKMSFLFFVFYTTSFFLG